MIGSRKQYIAVEHTVQLSSHIHLAATHAKQLSCVNHADYKHSNACDLEARYALQLGPLVHCYVINPERPASLMRLRLGLVHKITKPNKQLKQTHTPMHGPLSTKTMGTRWNSVDLLFTDEANSCCAKTVLSVKDSKFYTFPGLTSSGHRSYRDSAGYIEIRHFSGQP